MKKVLIISNSTNGLYHFRKELIAEMISNDCSVTLLTPINEYEKELTNLGVSLINIPIDRRGINPIKDFFLLLKYYNIISKINPDLVITYTIKPNLYGGIVASIKKIPYAINITGLGTTFQKENFLKKIVCFLYKKACRNAKVVFFENEENKNIFLQNKLATIKQVCCLNGAGVNLEDFPFTEYPTNEDSIRFLFVGRVMKEKGVDELFEVAQRIKNEYSNIYFDIVGPMEDDYKSTIDQLSNQGIIQYYGYQEDVKPFIERCHCFVLPSYHEGMANTLLECASMGRPLITSNIHGCKEAIDNNGFVCDVKDSEDLYLKVKQFIELEDSQKIMAAYNSRKHMEDVFDKNKVIKETLMRLEL